MIGITMGEIFYLKDLAADCAQDRVYEFFLLRAAAAHYQGGRIARQPHGDQIESLHGRGKSPSSSWAVS